jgi:Ribonuclease G/E
MVNKEKIRQQLKAAKKELKKLRDVEKELIAEQARRTRLENEVEWLRSLVIQPPALIASSTAPMLVLPSLSILKTSLMRFL